METETSDAIVFFGVFPVVAFVLLVGGVPGLPLVGTGAWGGLLVTLVLAVSGIVISLPLGILLAVQALAWAFGYRKAIADEAESA